MAMKMRLLMDFHQPAGLKQLTMAMYQTIGFKMSSWQLQLIWVIQPHLMEAFILETNRMLEPDWC